MVQLSKKFNDIQVKELIERYIANKIRRKYVQEILGIKKTRFFALVKQVKENSEKFSILYARKTPTRKISPDTERNIVKELKKEKELIANKNTPINYYNYSYIKDLLEQDYGKKVSLPTIIDRAKRYHFYFPRPKRKVHDREVVTNYTGELIQHDSSHHHFSPYTDKWYLIEPPIEFIIVLSYCPVKRGSFRSSSCRS
ncbi:MAG: hypothetical protein PHX56_08180 [Atribacterota bacterium]|nr:hypothetical protein [Atribacterota bacterium]